MVIPISILLCISQFSVSVRMRAVLTHRTPRRQSMYSYFSLSRQSLLSLFLY